MSKHTSRSLTDRIKLRSKVLWGTLILMLVYMVAIGALGLGDSRVMTQLAGVVSRIILFGGMIYLVFQIVRNKKLLNNNALRMEQERAKLDERQQFLHDKSGGIVVDILLLILLFTTCTAALCNMPAFYLSLAILAVTVMLKIGSYVIFDRYTGG